MKAYTFAMLRNLFGINLLARHLVMYLAAYLELP